MAALARWCYRHKVAVLLLWVVALVGIGGAAQEMGSSYSNSFSLPNTDSTKALNLLQNKDAKAAGETDNIVFSPKSPTAKVTDADIQQAMTQTFAKIAALPEVATVQSPYAPGVAGQISKDGRTAYANIVFTDQINNLKLADIQKVVDTGLAANSATLNVQMGGSAVQQTEQNSTGASEAIGYVAAFIVLLLAFGALVGAVLPIFIAIFSLGVGTSLIEITSHAASIPSLAPILAALIGIGVGIDYALFIVTRFRSGIRTGLSHEDAVVRALDTSGRAVIFAGTTVCIALLGMLVTGMGFLSGSGIGASIVVATTVLAAITLLPAVLGFKWVAKRTVSRRQRRALRSSGPLSPDPSGVFARWAGVVERRPKILAFAGVVIMAVLIIPTGSLRLGSSDQGNDPTSSTTRQAYDMLAAGFGPGFNGPLEIAAQLDSPGDATAANNLIQAIKTQPNVAAVLAAPARPGDTLAKIIVVPSTSPESVQTADLVDDLRANVVPAAEKGTTMHAYVGGLTAIYQDFAGDLSSKLPLFIGVVIGLGFLLLLLAFRSLVVPLTAVVMNLLAAGASFGVIVAMFQWGWGSNALHLGGAGPVESWLPVMMLAILFGLSMDYQVFLVSRMHEEWVHTGDNPKAVRVGQAETGRVITAAATIMICVFLSFLTTGQRPVAEFGVGLASAVALDAFVLRMLLVPSIMQMVGVRNWWIPAWLDRIMPHLSVEGSSAPPPRNAFLDPALFGESAQLVAAGPGLVESPDEASAESRR
ncbi:MAG TPA: MMPL family transporter [Actinocrinis sp.]|nr:MMPL family transporter [Actinocrinis sp.]